MRIGLGNVPGAMPVTVSVYACVYVAGVVESMTVTVKL
jgi:hypothetical protein